MAPASVRRSVCCARPWPPPALILTRSTSLISHMHGDHILGLKTLDGALAFLATLTLITPGDKRRAGIRGDQGDLTTNQIDRQAGQPIKLTLGLAIFVCDVLAFDVAEFFETVP